LGLNELETLALGLLIGTTAGAVLISLIRVQPRPAREIRVTVTPNALPQRRAVTLAVHQDRSIAAPPGRGGPGDLLTLGVLASGQQVSSGPSFDRTDVLLPVAVGALVAFGIDRERDPDLDSLRRPVEASAPMATARALAVADRRQAAAEPGRPSGPAGAGRADSTPTAASPVAEPCSEERRVAAERCDLADRLSEQAVAANHTLREQRRAYDELSLRAAQAAIVADPREIRAAKEAARIAFRRAHSAAHTRDAVEAAAAEWLTEINRVNQTAREAVTEGARAQYAATKLALAIERLGLEADVARINAESAAEACFLAREALAACEEAQVDRRAGRVPVDPAAVPIEAPRPKLIGGPEFEPGEVEEITPPSERVFAGGQPRILRVLRGDGDALRIVVDELAGQDPEERGRWQLLLSELVDACVARAIEASSLEFPADGFWAPFSQTQGRDIATALASLGYRFDGLGGFADGRLPSQRDLSLALGYAGLDPMRMRSWPSEATMPNLFNGVRVAADEYVAATASDLTLGEMVGLLRGRAEPLAELWNNWGRIRPVLLEA
jgi:hypothetical protein